MGLPQRERQVDFKRRISPAQAHRPWPASNYAIHRIVGGPNDRAVVVQKAVNHVSKPGLNRGIVGQHRLTSGIGRGRHQRAAKALQHQVMQRAIWQHHAQLTGRPGASPSGNPASGPLAHQHDRPHRTGDHRRFRLRRARQAVQPVDRGQHHRQRLVRPALALPQRRDRDRVQRIAHEVVAADALHREHLLAPQRRQRVIAGESQRRSACRTRHRVRRVEPPVRRVAILCRAQAAHRPNPAMLVLASVVRQPRDQRVGEARTGCS